MNKNMQNLINAYTQFKYIGTRSEKPIVQYATSHHCNTQL